MRQYGVVYAGKRERQHQFAALAVTGGKGMAGDPPASAEHWQRLVSQVTRAHRHRVIISSEYFDAADDEIAQKVVTELGGPSVHVLVTLRPLTKILPSQWQQYVRNRLRMSYDDWLDGMLREPPYDKPTPSFWRRHHHDVLVQRWASVVGPDNLTVVVVDESDGMSLLRLVEQLVGLPTGHLQPEVGWTNRSLTHGEIELVRHVNNEFRRRDWSGEMYRTFIRRGMVRHLQEVHLPDPDETPIHTPDWALDQVAQIGAEAAKKIEATGVRIIGDISTLGYRPPTAAENGYGSPLASLPPETVMKAVVGTILSATGEPSVAPDTPAGRPYTDGQPSPTSRSFTRTRQRTASSHT